MSKFILQSQEYGLLVSIRLDAECQPNQADLREAINRLLNCLGNWDGVDIEIKSHAES